MLTQIYDKMEEVNMAISADLWKVLNGIRSRLDVADFRQYVMPFIFYIVANQNVELLMRSELESDNISYADAWDAKDDDGNYIYRDELKEIQLEHFGFVIKPEFSCNRMVPAIIN